MCCNHRYCIKPFISTLSRWYLLYTRRENSSDLFRCSLQSFHKRGWDQKVLLCAVTFWISHLISFFVLSTSSYTAFVYFAKNLQQKHEEKFFLPCWNFPQTFHSQAVGFLLENMFTFPKRTHWEKKIWVDYNKMRFDGLKEEEKALLDE